MTNPIIAYSLDRYLETLPLEKQAFGLSDITSLDPRLLGAAIGGVAGLGSAALSGKKDKPWIRNALIGAGLGGLGGYAYDQYGDQVLDWWKNRNAAPDSQLKYTPGSEPEEPQLAYKPPGFPKNDTPGQMPTPDEATTAGAVAINRDMAKGMKGPNPPVYGQVDRDNEPKTLADSGPIDDDHQADYGNRQSHMSNQERLRDDNAPGLAITKAMRGIAPMAKKYGVTDAASAQIAAKSQNEMARLVGEAWLAAEAGRGTGPAEEPDFDVTAGEVYNDLGDTLAAIPGQQKALFGAGVDALGNAGKDTVNYVGQATGVTPFLERRRELQAANEAKAIAAREAAQATREAAQATRRKEMEAIREFTETIKGLQRSRR